MNICIISNYKKNGYGESTRPYYLSLYLRKQGYKILHLCDYDGFEDGIRYVRIQTGKQEPNILKRFAAFFKLSSIIRLFNPDIVYIHQFNSARWALATKAIPKRPFVFDAHTSVYFEASILDPDAPKYIEQMKNREQEICLKSDNIICASSETKDILKTTYHLAENKLYVVNNATNMQPLKEGEMLLHTKTEHTPFVCLATLPFDGFLSNELALAYLFEIATLVYAKNPTIQFAVLGGGEKPVPPTTNITYKGYVPELRKEILSANICLMPYPDNAVCGGARNKFCDFIALGKVVVSSPEGMRGMQVLENGKNCLVATNKYDYADKIISLSESPNEVKRLEAEVMTVKDLFSWEDRARQVEEIFKKIVSV